MTDVDKVKTYGFNHTICEVCWFAREPTRFPLQVARKVGDNITDRCCLCDSMKVTRIWVRLDPAAEPLRCAAGEHEH